MSEKVDAYVKQTFRYFYDDGLVELMIGVFFMLVGGVLLATQLWNQMLILNLIMVISLIVVIVGGVSLLNMIIRNLKQRVTYPRTGYVAYKNEVDKRSNSVVWVAVLLLITASLFLPAAFAQMQFMVGGVLAAMLCFLGYRMNSWRFYMLAVGTFGLTVVVSLSSPQEVAGTALIFLGVGCLLLLSGGVVLVRYLQQHPVVENGDV